MYTVHMHTHRLHVRKHAYNHIAVRPSLLFRWAERNLGKSRGVQYVHWVMHKCIMAKVGGKNYTESM